MSAITTLIITIFVFYLRKITTLHFQFIFSCTGWFVSYEIWKFFNPETKEEEELDLDFLFNFAFGDQGALNNIGIGLGYVSRKIQRERPFSDKVMLFLFPRLCPG